MWRACWAAIAISVLACAQTQTQAPPASPPPAEPPPSATAGSPGTDPIPPSGKCSGDPPGPGYECVQSCGPPVASQDDPPPGYQWLSPEDAKNRAQFGCPICLPADALIGTPTGPVAISELVAGGFVWSVDGAGRRTSARVRAVMSVPVPPGHTLSVLELADGRVVRASAGHPAADGRKLGALAPGATLDGSTVVSVRQVAYGGSTFDIVLDHDPQLYFADGVLVKSSLAE